MDQSEDTETTGLRQKLERMHAEHREHNYGDLPWKAWGSWFSWGSPVGLSIFLCSLLISVGIFLLLLHDAGLLH